MIYNIPVLLQPTSLLRTAVDIRNALQMLSEKDAQAIISVCEADIILSGSIFYRLMGA